MKAAHSDAQQALQQTHKTNSQREDPLVFLYSSDSEEGEDVRRVRVSDEGSCPWFARVKIEGVTIEGIIDSGADISIMGGELLKRVAAVVRLRKKNFKRADKVPRTYDQKPFPLDGCMDLDVAFSDKTMKTPIYIKIDAHDQLLSKGVCRQLAIISNHPDVQAGPSKKSQSTRMTREFKSEDVAAVPTLWVRLSQSVHLPPRQSSFVSVRVENHSPEIESILLENDPKVEEITGVQVDDALLMPTKQGFAQLLVSNRSGFTQSIEEGVILGEAVEATVISQGDVPPQECGSEASVAGVRIHWRSTQILGWSGE